MNGAVVFPPERQGRAPPPDLIAQREQLADAVRRGVWQTALPPAAAVLGQCRVLRFRPEREVKGYVLHFHGGGFRIGAPEMVGPFALALARRCGVEVVVPQYRLAPENPFPAGLADGQTCLRALREEMEDRPLVVSGDSAGGGLAASLGVLSQTDPSLWMDGLILLSPWLDLTVSAPSYSANAADDPLFSEQVARNAADLYLQGVNPRHPLASPLLARIESFPSTLINVGAREVLADDAVLFHEKLRSAGVQSELLTIGGMEHTAVVRSANLLGAAESFDRIAHFISRVIAAP